MNSLSPYSSAKYARCSRESYMVGALARFNLNSAKLHPAAKKACRGTGDEYEDIQSVS